MRTPKKVSFRVAYFDSAVAPYTITADTEEQAQACQNDPRFICWLTGWETCEFVQ